MTPSEGDWRKRVEVLQASLLGRDGLLRDRPLIAHVRLTAIEGNAVNVTFSYRILPSPGFTALLGMDADVRASWDVLAVSPQEISSGLGGWHLYFDPDLVDHAVTSTAPLGEQVVIADLGSLKQAMRRYTHVVKPVDDFISRRTPGGTRQRSPQARD